MKAYIVEYRLATEWKFAHIGSFELVAAEERFRNYLRIGRRQVDPTKWRIRQIETNRVAFTDDEYAYPVTEEFVTFYWGHPATCKVGIISP